MAINKATSQHQQTQLFSKIEALLSEAVQQELAQIIAPLINAHMTRLMAEQAASQPKQGNEDDESGLAAIRETITSYVIEVLEAEAPAIITHTLKKALMTASADGNSTNTK